jgi:tetratricopeptide (TPR) repeat protein
MPALVRAGNTAEGLEVRKQAIHLAHATGDRRLLIDTITAWNVPTPWTPRSYRVVDDDLVAIVDELLTDPSLSARERCLVLCTRVRETSYQDDPGAEAAAREALDVARTAGDPELIAFALHAQSEVYLPDLHPAQWDELRRQLHAVADGNDLIVFGLLAELLDLRAAGARLDLPRWRAHLDNVRAVARRYELRQALVVSIILDGLYAHLTGELERAEAAYFEAYAAQRRVNGVDADGQLLLALATIRLSQGRLSELTDRLAEATVRFPAAADAYGLALAGLGRMDEARRALRNPPKIYADYLWQIWTTIRALAVAAVGERDRAPELYAALLPYADQVAGAASSGFVLTPVARALGQLAALLDRPDGALAHFRQAGDVARRCGNSAWLAQIERDMAALGAVHS